MADNKHSGSTPHFVTIDAIGEPRRVVWLDKEERRAAHRGPRSCQELGICQNRYPACGQCDDDHPEDEPPTPTPFEQIASWLAILWWAMFLVAAIGITAGYVVTVIDLAP